ncbi:MAG: HAMP domain-containing histidine kinase [Ruminococcus sp.]|nr:HAMP domain-containing histidine kinase [Ruminococcus sp.]
MIKRLQRKFVLIVALCLLAVEVVIIGVINIVNIHSIDSDYDDLMQMLVENDGKIPDFPKRDDGFRHDKKDMLNDEHFKDKNFNEETKYQTRYFIVDTDSSEKVTGVNTGHIAAVTSEKAVDYAKQALESGKENGYIDIYKYRIKDTDKGKTIIFLDTRSGSQNKNRFMLISVLVAATGYVITCLLVMIFSKRAVRPAIDSFEKQRRFITDAGHEIKTPLAIISANTEVIELTSEENEWTRSIKNQVVRLDGLVKNLLQLAKMEEDDVKLVFADIDMSKAVRETVQPFGALAQTNGETLVTDIDEGIFINGDEAAIKQLTSILVENAVKYADDDSEIKVSLKRTASGKHARLSVSNRCEEPPRDTDKLFDRFYRSDSSRTRNGEKVGGYGIGLSIAQATVVSHKGRIECAVKDKTVTFTASFRTVQHRET